MRITRTPQRTLPALQTADIVKPDLVGEGRPRLPPVPDEIARLLYSQEARYRFTETSYYVVEQWQPRHMDATQAHSARQFLHLVETVMQPMDKGLLLTRVLALLSHYRSDPNPPEVEYAIAQDWAEDLGEFPGWVVEEAARQWRRTKKFKPQICEMREACERIDARERTLLKRLRQLIDAHGAHLDPARQRVASIASTIAERFSPPNKSGSEGK
jgi:hypothetical protein